MKRILSFITAAVIGISGLLPSAAYSADSAGYEYTIINNEATITGFKGEPEYISIPETIEGCRVTELRDNAFYECTSLKHIDIPDGVTKLGHHCFYACTSLESIALPASAADIGMGCFCGCSELRAASVSADTLILPESCFRACTSLTSFTVPDSVETIGDFCFSGCTSLKEVSIGSRVCSLGDCSLYMCSSMNSLYIPPSVEKIGVCAAGYIPTENGAAVKDGFTILGAASSEAKKYAKDNHITFTDAGSSVHAFAIQSISGERRPITIPSVMLFAGAALAFAALIITKRKRRILLKAKNNKNFAK